MGINTDIWGTPEDWSDGDFPFSEGDLKFSISYYDIYDNGSVDLNTIDISPYFWGISKNALWCKPCYLSPYIRDDVVMIDKRDVLTENKDLPVLFQNTPTQRGTSYSFRYAPDRTDVMSNSAQYYRNVIMSFNYQKVKIIPYVIYKAEGYSSSSYSGTLYDYVTTQKYLTYPHITTIGYRVIYGNGVDASNPSKSMAILTPYDVKGYDVYYGSDTFYAQSGMQTLAGAWGFDSDTNCIADSTVLRTNINYSVADPDTAFAYKYSLSASALPDLYFYDGDPIWQLYTDYTSGGTRYYYVHYYIDVNNNNLQDVINYVFKQMAFIGLPFIYDPDDKDKTIGDEGVYLPIFDDYGVTTGEFAEGDAALEQRNSEWIDGRESGFDPNRPPTPGGEDRGDLTNSYANRYTNAGGLSQYVVSEEEVIKLAAFLNGRYLPTAADLDADFKGTNPQQYIVSVQKYPFSLPNAGGTADIYVGQQNTGINGKPLFATFGQIGVLPINNASTFDFGTIDLSDPEYMSGNFLDYQKKLLLYMPFVGTEELDPRLYFGHVLGLVYRIDYNTGAVAAEIKRDGLTMETKTSTISITIPFMAADMGSFQNQLAQLSYAKDLAKIKGAGTALSAGFTMAAGAQGTMSSGQPPLAALSNLTQAGVQLAANAAQLSQLDYHLEHTAPNVGTISTAAAANAFFMDARARLVVVFPSMLAGYNAQEYSHIIGNACCKTGKLGSFSGFTVCSTADLSGVTTKGSAARIPTEAEKELIRKVLLTGIYL